MNFINDAFINAILADATYALNRNNLEGYTGDDSLLSGQAIKYGFENVRGGIRVCSWGTEISEKTIIHLTTKFRIVRSFGGLCYALHF